MATQHFTFTSSLQIHIAPHEQEIHAEKGETITFELANKSGLKLLDWGLYFNNPFEPERSVRYSFGSQSSHEHLYRAEKRVAQDTDKVKVSMYNAYALYLVAELKDGQQQLFQLDPEIIINNGDIHN
ncbi:hypothetical protein QWY20_16725 [Alkalimonas sp. MEB108]|uniref:Uncharacterized protein n=1 Tax=Alkalimonas cellulosilytica TaxID=3058395 RepID=A0ABU7J982_9GAMM|nr:hypothetical protein [Alkalimonas sp. MEB108]MEE2003106.1 hypothetical protein [Alkalimonas sp. MEB108]